MVTLKHRDRRGPNEIVLIDGVKYDLDGEGCVEVPEEAVGKLTASPLWKDPSEWAESDRIRKAAALPVTGGQRRVRTAAELSALGVEAGISVEQQAEMARIRDEARAAETLRLAKKLGVKIGEAHPAPKLVPELVSEPTEDPEPEAEEITISDDMTRAELMAIAKANGLEVKRTMKKAEVLALFEQE